MLITCYSKRVVITASQLPDPKEVSYDMLLTCVVRMSIGTEKTDSFVPRIDRRMLSYLDLYGWCPFPSFILSLTACFISRKRLYCRLFDSWGPLHPRLELGMEGLPKSRSQVGVQAFLLVEL